MDSHGSPTGRYIPAPGTAQCPYCATVVDEVFLPSAARFAAFHLDCPGCGRGWSEIRDHQGVARYYERALIAEVTAIQAPA